MQLLLKFIVGYFLVLIPAILSTAPQGCGGRIFTVGLHREFSSAAEEALIMQAESVCPPYADVAGSFILGSPPCRPSNASGGAIRKPAARTLIAYPMRLRPKPSVPVAVEMHPGFWMNPSWDSDLIFELEHVVAFDANGAVSGVYGDGDLLFSEVVS